MTELYAWLAEHPEHGWTQISAFQPHLKGWAVLTTIDREQALAEGYVALAGFHHQNSGQPVRLVRFEEAETLMDAPPDVEIINVSLDPEKR